MINWKMWLRWSWRDLRERWLQVLAIGMIIALGTGVFSGLTGQETWRVASYDQSYGRLNMHDLHIALSSDVSEDDLLRVLRPGGEPLDGIAQLEARLIESTLVDASTNGDEILVPGRIVGMDVRNGGPHIDSLYVEDGRHLTEDDAVTSGPLDQQKPAVIVEYKFADHYTLEPGDPVSISGGIDLDFVGTAHSPEYFAVLPEGNIFGDESDYAVLFMPVETAQLITGQQSEVNNLVVLLEEGVDPNAAIQAIERAVGAAQKAGDLKKFDMTITTKAEDFVHKSLYSDAEQDQGIWYLISILFLLGAAMGAFNLAGRIVEAQRRQIGIGMALGLPRRWIAFRPLLVGAQIALLGTILGLSFGLALSHIFSGVFQDVMPVPYWTVPFYWQGYVGGALLGILLPFLATLLPVWRAVRVPPVDAIQSGYLVAKGGGLSWVAESVPLPGKSFTHMPINNLLRSPWRTLLTILGVSIAIVLMVMFVGFLDTFTTTIQQGEEAWLYQGADRVVVGLDFFYPIQPDEQQTVYPPTFAERLPDPIPAIRDMQTGNSAPLLAEPLVYSLSLNGKLLGQEELDIMLEMQDMDNPIWVPELKEGELTSDEPGIIISQKAASDLDLDVGDMVPVQYVKRDTDDPTAFPFETTVIQVIGIHNNPLRALAYMDLRHAALMNLDGTANQVVALPTEGVDIHDIEMALFNQRGVSSVREMKDISDLFDEVMELFTTILRIIQGVVVFLAFLIAFNSTSINVDERTREIATMFAFGLRVRTATQMQMLENFIIGVIGTLIGLVGGWWLLNAVLAARVEEQLEDFHFIVTISPETLLTSLLLGVLTVTLTPLLSIRRMIKIDLPSAIRVME